MPAEATWNLRVVSKTPPLGAVRRASPTPTWRSRATTPSRATTTATRSGTSPIPRQPALKTAYVCPASQSDVSVYKNLLFVSGEDLPPARLRDPGRGGHGQHGAAPRHPDLRHHRHHQSEERRQRADLPRLAHPHGAGGSRRTRENVYVYISGSSARALAERAAGLRRAAPDKDPNSALFRIEVIKVPLAHPGAGRDRELAADLPGPGGARRRTARRRRTSRAQQEGRSPRPRPRGGYVVTIEGEEEIVPPTGHAARCWTASSSAPERHRRADRGRQRHAARRRCRPWSTRWSELRRDAEQHEPGPTQCHDITVYPAIGLAGGACEGYGLLLDISDPGATRSASARWPTPTSPTGTRRRSTTTAPRSSSPTSGAAAASRSAARPTSRSGAPTRSSRSTNRKMQFQSYYKLPAPQTPQENCVAHNGSLIPIPGRDVMVQAWYQGGISVFDWTDPDAPEGDRLLRSRPGGLDQDGERRVRGRSTGTTASSSAPRSRAGSTSSS